MEKLQNPSDINEAVQLAQSMRTWRTKHGCMLAPTTHLNYLSAIATAFSEMNGFRLGELRLPAGSQVCKATAAPPRQKAGSPTRETPLRAPDCRSHDQVQNSPRHTDVLDSCLTSGGPEAHKENGHHESSGCHAWRNNCNCENERSERCDSSKSRLLQVSPSHWQSEATEKSDNQRTRTRGPLLKVSRTQIVSALKTSEQRVHESLNETRCSNVPGTVGFINACDQDDHLGHASLSSTRVYIQPTTDQHDARKKAGVARLLLQ